MLLPIRAKGAYSELLSAIKPSSEVCGFGEKSWVFKLSLKKCRARQLASERRQRLEEYFNLGFLPERTKLKKKKKKKTCGQKRYKTDVTQNNLIAMFCDATPAPSASERSERVRGTDASGQGGAQEREPPPCPKRAAELLL